MKKMKKTRKKHNKTPHMNQYILKHMKREMDGEKMKNWTKRGQKDEKMMKR